MNKKHTENMEMSKQQSFSKPLVNINEDLEYHVWIKIYFWHHVMDKAMRQKCKEIDIYENKMKKNCCLIEN